MEDKRQYSTLGVRIATKQEEGNMSAEERFHGETFTPEEAKELVNAIYERTSETVSQEKELVESINITGYRLRIVEDGWVLTILSCFNDNSCVFYFSTLDEAINLMNLLDNGLEIVDETGKHWMK